MATTKHILALTLLLAASLGAMAQKELGALPDMQVAGSSTTVGTTRLSPAAAMLLADLEQLGRDVRRKDKDLIARYPLSRSGCRYYVQALVSMSAGHSFDELKAFGVKPGHTALHSMSVRIPTRRLAALAESGIAASIDVSLPRETKKLK